MKPHHKLTRALAPALLIATTALLGGCCSSFRHKPPPQEPAQPQTTVAVPVSGTELDLTNMEKVRLGERLKAYPVNRYVDPNDPNILHESHVVYRKETGASWNLTPRAPTVVPLGPTLAVSDPAEKPTPTSADIEQRMNAQTRLMSALTEQNETLVAELARLHRELASIRAANGINISTGNYAQPATTTPTTTR